MWFSGMSNGDCLGAVEDEEKDFNLAFRSMGKDLGSITIRAIRINMVLHRNSSLLDLALNLGSRESTYTLWPNDCCINWSG